MHKHAVKIICLVILGANAILMLFIEEYVVSIICILTILGWLTSIYLNKNDTTTPTPISDDVAEAMASKIIFEAKQHRQIRKKDEYSLIDSNEKE